MKVPAATALLLAVLGAPSGRAAEPEQFVFERLNRSYSGVVDEMVPVEQGGMSVKLRAPSHRLTIRSHLIELRALGGGLYAADVTIEFLGLAHIIADLDVGGVGNALEDDIVVPLQRRTVEARVRLARESGGYQITLVELPEALAVDIESGLGRSLVSWCDGVLGLLGFDCGTVEGLFSRAVVPMPEPGGVFLLDPAELTPAEQERFDAYLAANGPAPEPPTGR